MYTSLFHPHYSTVEIGTYPVFRWELEARALAPGRTVGKRSGRLGATHGSLDPSIRVLSLIHSLPAL